MRISSLIAAVILAAAPFAHAEEATGLLARIHRFTTVASTVPDNGDQNPYAIVVVPEAIGGLRPGDVLVTNFNDRNNLQGLGSTIVVYRPATRVLSQFAAIPRDLAGCPGGIGLTTAMAVLKSGWVIVGSLPSRDGTTATKGAGCLVILDADGRVAGTLTSAAINGPWGNMAVIDDGATARLFVSNAGFDVGAPGQAVVRKANVIRLDLAIAPGGKPVVTRETVIADGFGQQASADVFIIGPTGLALGTNGDLYVSDAIDNRIVAIAAAATRTSSAGLGREVTAGGFLRRPLAMTTTPSGTLLVTNGLNGQCVEIDPLSGKQLHALWIDANKAQSPPGSGNLFGIAMAPDGASFYYVKDEMNTLVLAK